MRARDVARAHGSYIKLDAQVVHCDLDSPRHWIRLSHPIKHNVDRRLSNKETGGISGNMTNERIQGS